jgi:hypothetical protein
MSLNIPNFTSFSLNLEPLRTYHFARGLTLSFRGLVGTLSGGQSHSLIYNVNGDGAVEGLGSQSAYHSIISNIENITTSRLIAASDSLISFRQNENGKSEPIISSTELIPAHILFVKNDQFVSDANLGEILLNELNRVEENCRIILTAGGETESIFHNAYEQVLGFQDENIAGRVGLSELNQLISKATPMLKEAFFL